LTGLFLALGWNTGYWVRIHVRPRGVGLSNANAQQMEKYIKHSGSVLGEGVWGRERDMVQGSGS